MMNLCPGPSQLFFTVRDHIRIALKQGIAEIPNDSELFEGIFRVTVQNIRRVLAVPETFTILFTKDADIIRERIFNDLADNCTAHLVNGAVSRRFYEAALKANKTPSLFEWKGEPDVSIDPAAELIAIVHDESSTGVSIPLDFISRWADKNPDALMAIDASSSLPYTEFPYDHVDTLFFDVHFGFGLPVGLAVWIVNRKCLDKANTLRLRKGFRDSFQSLTTLNAHAQEGRSPGYANTLGIYLLNEVIKDMLSRGLVAIRHETDYKAALLYQLLDRHPLMDPAAHPKALRSKTVIVADCGDNYEKIALALRNNRFSVGEGMGPQRHRQLRFANFPAHSREQYERLIDILEVTQ
jgi:phosphoserine aminotransferase